METEPYVMDMNELGILLDEQEKIGKTFQNTAQREDMDKFLLEEVLGENRSFQQPEVEVQIRTTEQSNQVCYISLYFFKKIKYCIIIRILVSTTKIILNRI